MHMGGNAVRGRWHKLRAATFLTALYFNGQKINNIKTEAHSLWKQLHQGKNRTEKAKRDYNRRYPKGQMKSWVMRFLKTTKKKLFPQSSCKCPASQFFTVFFKLRGEFCCQKCQYSSLESMMSLSEKGKHSPFCRHAYAKLVPYHTYCSKSNLLVQAASSHLQTVAAEDRVLPVLTVTVRIWHKQEKAAKQLWQ